MSTPSWRTTWTAAALAAALGCAACSSDDGDQGGSDADAAGTVACGLEANCHDLLTYTEGMRQPVEGTSASVELVRVDPAPRPIWGHGPSGSSTPAATASL